MLAVRWHTTVHSLATVTVGTVEVCLRTTDLEWQVSLAMVTTARAGCTWMKACTTQLAQVMFVGPERWVKCTLSDTCCSWHGRV
jgi:hypothetical protein